MRLHKTDFLANCKSNLKIEFAKQNISAHGGLELIRRYFRLIGLHRRIRSAFAGNHIGGDYGVCDMILAIIVLLLTGGRRLEHMKYLSADPLVKRFCGLLKLPCETSVARWLKRFTMKSLQALIEINSQIVCESIDEQGLTRLTIDVDGSVLTTGSSVAWAFRGFNPHHRKHLSYYPISAHLAQTGHILKVKNRPGNVHDSKQAVPFIRELIDDIRLKVHRYLPIEFRMDGAFFQKNVINLLESRNVTYAIKVPFFKWLGLVPIIRERKRWNPVSQNISCFELNLNVDCWDKQMRVVVYRKKVSHKSRKNYQLDLFDPNDGHFEYSAITTNSSLKPKSLWSFMAGRGAHEKTYAELKGEWALDVIPTNHYQANSAWQQISVLGYNLIRNFQLTTTAKPKTKTRKKTYAFLFNSLKTLRFKLINQPARIVKPNGCQILKFSVAPAAVDLIKNIDQNLQLAA